MLDRCETALGALVFHDVNRMFAEQFALAQKVPVDKVAIDEITRKNCQQVSGAVVLICLSKPANMDLLFHRLAELPIEDSQT